MGKRKQLHSLLFLIAAVLFIQNCMANFYTDQIKITPDELVKYTTRFAVNQDSLLKVRARAKVNTPTHQGQTANIKVLLMNDAEWDMSLETDICEDKEKLARFTIPLKLKTDGTWTRWESSTVKIIVRAQVWYILIADCGRETHSKIPDMDYITYELEMTNDGSHFSHEYWGVLPTSIIALLTFSYLLWNTTMKLMKEIKKNEEYETPLFPLLAAILCEFVQLA